MRFMNDRSPSVVLPVNRAAEYVSKCTSSNKVDSMVLKAKTVWLMAVDQPTITELADFGGTLVMAAVESG